MVHDAQSTLAIKVGSYIAGRYALYTYVLRIHQTVSIHASHRNWAKNGQQRHRQANARVLNLTEGRKRQILTSIQRSESAFSFQLSLICQTTTNIWLRSLVQSGFTGVTNYRCKVTQFKTRYNFLGRVCAVIGYTKRRFSK